MDLELSNTHSLNVSVIELHAQNEGRFPRAKTVQLTRASDKNPFNLLVSLECIIAHYARLQLDTPHFFPFSNKEND